MKYEEMKMAEQTKVCKYFANWMKNYTNEVVIKVMAKAEEIMNNPAAMMMLEELYKREQDERDDLVRSMEMLIQHYEDYKKFDVHNYVLTHSQSYRDVLYDLYIRNI